MKKDIFHIRKTLKINGRDKTYYSLPELCKQGYNVNTFPFSIRILLENALRNYDGFLITKDNINPHL